MRSGRSLRALLSSENPRGSGTGIVAQSAFQCTAQFTGCSLRLPCAWPYREESRSPLGAGCLHWPKSQPAWPQSLGRSRRLWPQLSVPIRDGKGTCGQPPPSPPVTHTGQTISKHPLSSVLLNFMTQGPGTPRCWQLKGCVVSTKTSRNQVNI